MSPIVTLQAIAARSTSVLIAEQIRDRIVDGAFRPGEQINEAQVAAQLGVSRGPVREALQRLVQEGLLVAKPNRGVFVLEMTAKDVAEIYAVREVIECAAAEVVAGKSDSERADLALLLIGIAETMRAPWDEGMWTEVCRADLAFHSALVEASGNARLIRAYRTLATESLICMINTDQVYPDGYDVVGTHRHLADLIERGDMDEIHAGLHEHLTTADDYLSYAMHCERHHHAADA